MQVALSRVSAKTDLMRRSRMNAHQIDAADVASPEPFPSIVLR